MIELLSIPACAAMDRMRVTRILDDDVQISQAYHRTSLTPGQDLTGQSDNVKSICAAAWTPEVIAAHQVQQI